MLTRLHTLTSITVNAVAAFVTGHGVVAGFKEALEVDNPDGYNQGMVAATIGLLVGTITGWGMVNWGYYSGKLSALRSVCERERARARVRM